VIAAGFVLGFLTAPIVFVLTSELLAWRARARNQ
jgi:hypothetical protein